MFRFCALCGPFVDVPDALAREPAIIALPDAVLGLHKGRGLAQCFEGLPYGRRHRHLAGALFYSGERPPFAGFPSLQVLPGEADQRGYACAGGAEGDQQGVVSRVVCAQGQAPDGACGGDSSGAG